MGRVVLGRVVFGASCPASMQTPLWLVTFVPMVQLVPKMGQVVKFVELVHDCILSKQQRNEMNRRYCDAIWSGMKALTAPHLCSQLHSIQATRE